MSNFYIVKVAPGQPEEPVAGEGPFDTGPLAAERAKALTSKTGFKHQPRRLSQTDPEAWKERERTLSKTRKPLPKRWLELNPNPDHFLHIKEDQIGFVFYFPDNDAGMLNKSVKTKPGRYLKEFYPDLNQEEAKVLIAEVENMTDVIFATTGPEMRWVYEHGPSSCMAAKAAHYGTGEHHPCEVYAGGDLAVAYLISGEKSKGGRATARVVCHPERKEYGRIYGDEARLGRSLRALGYTQVNSFKAGVRMAKIPLKGNPGAYVAGYFDNFGWMKDEGDHFVTIGGRGEAVDHRAHIGAILVAPGRSDGKTTAHRYCPKNGNSQPWTGSESWPHVEGVDQDWSPSAVRYHAVLCSRTKQYWPIDQKYVCTIRSPHEETWSIKARDEALASGDVFQCSVTKAYYTKTQLKKTDGDKKISLEGYNKLIDEERRIAAAEKQAAERMRKMIEETRRQQSLEIFSDIEAKSRPAREKTVAKPQYRTMVNLNGRVERTTTVFSGNDHLSYATVNEEVRA